MSMKLDMKDFQELVTIIAKKGEDAQEAADEALSAAADLIAENLTTAASPYAGRGRKGYATGKMYGTILHERPEWSGSIATVRAGFRISDALESVFIMYGTPKIPKDTKVYNAIMGTKTRKEIQQKQEEILSEYMGLGG